MRGPRAAWVGFGLSVCCGLLLGVASVRAQASAGAASLTGEWELTTTIFGVPLGERLNLKVEKGTLTGSIWHRGKSIPVTGRVDGDSIRFEYKDTDGARNAYVGHLEGAALSGPVRRVTGGDTWGDDPPADWTRAPRGRRPSRRAAHPRLRADRVPRVFSSDRAPGPEDLARRHGAHEDRGRRRRGRAGHGARPRRQPPDRPVLRRGRDARRRARVRIRKLRLNRANGDQRRRPGGPRARTTTTPRSTRTTTSTTWSGSSTSRRAWHARQADAAAEGSLRPGPPDARLRRRRARASARPRSAPAIRAGFGGNMDFSEIREGATVYLPVSQPGALLYVGDGHARPGRRRVQRQRARDVVSTSRSPWT